MAVDEDQLVMYMLTTGNNVELSGQVALLSK